LAKEVFVRRSRSSISFFYKKNNLKPTNKKTKKKKKKKKHSSEDWKQLLHRDKETPWLGTK